MQEAEEAAAAEVLKLQQELEMEEAGLEPHPEVDEDNLDDDDADNGEMVPSDQQSYQLYVQVSKQASGDDEDANMAARDITTHPHGGGGAAAEDECGAKDDDDIFSEEEPSSASDPLRRRRVSHYL